MNSSPFPIVARIQAARDCTQVTAPRLAKLKGELRLDDKGISSLKAGDFPGLSKLTEIWLGTNQLSTLPVDVFDGLSALWFLDLEEIQLSALSAGVFDGLSALEELNLETNRLSSLPEDVFDGLSSLYWISLPSNRLTTLPDGVFEGLSALGILEVQDNSVDPMVLAVSLERVGNNGFKATVPAGAPFTMTLPVSVTNGSIDGGATTLRIPVGAVESGTVTATRTTGTTAAVTADIGTSLPPPPPRNLGYALARAPGLPLEVLPELAPELSVSDGRASEGDGSPSRCRCRRRAGSRWRSSTRPRAARRRAGPTSRRRRGQ